MAESPSFHDESLAGSDTEYVPEPRAAVRTGKGRGKSQRKQSRGRRTRSSVRLLGESLSIQDARRVEELQQQRIAQERERIRSLNLESSHKLLERCLTRDPSLLFDIMDETSSAPPVAAPASDVHWCICTNCREMPTDIEKKCCQQHPQACISRLPQMEAYILQEGVLRLARRMWNDIRAVADLPIPGESNREFRHAAYRQFVVWQYGALGHGHRVVIPSCCVWSIRDRYPDPHGQYTGFIPRRI